MAYDANVYRPYDCWVSIVDRWKGPRCLDGVKSIHHRKQTGSAIGNNFRTEQRPNMLHFQATEATFSVGFSDALTLAVTCIDWFTGPVCKDAEIVGVLSLFPSEDLLGSNS